MHETTIHLILGLAWPVVTLVLGALTLWKVCRLCTELQERELSHKEKTRQAEATDPAKGQSGSASGGNNPSAGRGDRLTPKRPTWQWVILSSILILVLVVGFLAIVFKGHCNGATYLFATAAFSIAYALHFLAVSIGINGVILRQKNEQIRNEIREQTEYPIVTSGMKVLGGGLGILCSGGLLLVFGTKWLAALVYVAGAFFLGWGVLKYAWRQRSWPRTILNIIPQCDGKDACQPGHEGGNAKQSQQT